VEEKGDGEEQGQEEGDRIGATANNDSDRHGGDARSDDSDPASHAAASNDSSSTPQPPAPPLLFLSVPVGTDVIVWNLLRRYGRARLPLLLRPFSLLDTVGWVPGDFYRGPDGVPTLSPGQRAAALEAALTPGTATGGAALDDAKRHYTRSYEPLLVLTARPVRGANATASGPGTEAAGRAGADRMPASDPVKLTAAKNGDDDGELAGAPAYDSLLAAWQQVLSAVRRGHPVAKSGGADVVGGGTVRAPDRAEL
jgi:hypothetical protein